jgi:hypothetical protein
MSIRFPNMLESARFRLALLVVAVVILGSFGMSVRARLKNRLPSEAAASAEVPAQNLAALPSQARAPGTRLTSHLLTLRPSGFEPAEAVWPRGPFFLSIDNRSNVNDITLRVDRRAGGRVKEVNLKMRKQRSAGVFNPPPGQYLLTEANHPEWICHITISPQ